jgi:hypothetical protein
MERVSIGSSPSVLVRIDRVTGKPEVLAASGWSLMVDPAKAVTSPVDLPADQIKKIGRPQMGEQVFDKSSIWHSRMNWGLR